MAIVRHEFHPQYRVASATPSFGTRCSSERVSAPPSLIAPMRGSTARSAVLATQRQSQIAAHHAIIPIGSVVSAGIATSGIATTTTTLFPFAPPQRGIVQRLERTPHYACLMEAV